MKFLGAYLRAHANDYRKYTFRSWDAPASPVHLEWNVSGPSFLAHGGSRIDSPSLGLMAENDDGVVLFVDWSAGTSITLLAASDTQLRLTPAALSPPVPIQPDNASLIGEHGAVTVDGDALVVELLQGEKVQVTT